MERYLLQASTERENWFVATDTEAGNVLRFEKREFNNTQKGTQLDDIKYNYNTATQLDVAMSNLTDWLFANHLDILGG